MNEVFTYEDILYRPRPVSERHAPMPALSRAAIFSPYAALTGFEGQILDACHQRCNRILLTEEEQVPIHRMLRALKKHDRITVTYFLYSPGTDGHGGFAEGEYLTLTGTVLSLTPSAQTLRLETPETTTDINFEDILSLSYTKNAR
ncbi:MAG: hypothetical protein KBT01_02345 [Clostridiales bacterium]|nr:hypothetical protein [Candidatus Blautia equi]